MGRLVCSLGIGLLLGGHAVALERKANESKQVNSCRLVGERGNRAC